MNAATMELGATVCTARSPKCELCPLAELCAWRAAGFPDTGDERRRQARYEGSDRQARGAVLRALRDAAPRPLRIEDVAADWPDPLQRDRAIDSLIADGLAEASAGSALAAWAPVARRRTLTRRLTGRDGSRTRSRDDALEARQAGRRRDLGLKRARSLAEMRVRTGHGRPQRRSAPRSACRCEG